MEREKKVLISTIYSPDVVVTASWKLSPDVLILLDSRQKDNKKEYEAMTKAIEEVKTALEKMPVEIKTEKIPKLYEIVSIAKKTIEVIDKEYKEGTQIQIHISGGRKTLGFGVQFAAYTRKKKVKALYYVIKETNKTLQLPLLDLKLGGTKQKLLEMVNEGKTDMQRLIKELDITKALVYSHIKDLRHDGYIEDGELMLTEIGKIAIM